MNTSFVYQDDTDPKDQDTALKGAQLDSCCQIFIHENKSQIRDEYKISSSIGQGKCLQSTYFSR